MFPWLLPVMAFATGLVAAITDLRSGRIPNWLTFSAAVLGLAGHSLHHGVAGLIAGLLGAVVCAAVPGIVYKASQGRGIGGGDIKLFAALGALLGPTQGLEIELSSFLLLGIYALFRLAFLGQIGRTLVGSFRVTVGLFAPGSRALGTSLDAPMTSMRMGPAVFVGVVTMLSLPYVIRWMPWLG